MKVFDLLRSSVPDRLVDIDVALAGGRFDGPRSSPGDLALVALAWIRAPPRSVGAAGLEPTTPTL